MAAPRDLGPVRVVPADRVAFDDLALVFGVRGSASRCWCQRYKLAPRESFGSFPAEERAHRLRGQAGCDGPPGGGTSGLVALAGDDPVGWCAVEPRPAFTGLVRHARVPWEGRAEDRSDQSVWAVTCVLVRAGRRRRGVGGLLVHSAVDHARARGARAVEGYPLVRGGAVDEERHVGTLGMFLAAGLEEVGRPTPRRAVVRLDL